MRRQLTRRALAVLAALLAVPLLGMSVAWACTALATIDMDKTEGAAAGETVNGTGRGFSATSPNEVEIRLDGREGPLLASVRSLDGTIAFQFTVPQVAPGEHIVVAVQDGITSEPVAGTPAKAPFTVVDPAAPPAQRPAAPPAQQQPAAPAPAVPAQPAPEPAPAAAAAGPDLAAPVAEPAAPALAAPAPDVAAPADAGLAVAPAERQAVMAPQPQSLVLPLVMAAVGLLLSLGSGAAVLATRRRTHIPAEAEARR